MFDAMLPSLSREVARLAELVDNSGWEVFVAPAPNPWYWRCARDFQHSELLTDLSHCPS